MSENGRLLIQMEGVTKVFVTDEVETHALSQIHLEIKSGEYIAISGPSGCGRPVRLRKVDPSLHPRPARFAERRRLQAE